MLVVATRQNVRKRAEMSSFDTSDERPITRRTLRLRPSSCMRSTRTTKTIGACPTTVMFAVIARK